MCIIVLLTFFHNSFFNKTPLVTLDMNNMSVYFFFKCHLVHLVRSSCFLIPYNVQWIYRWVYQPNFSKNKRNNKELRGREGKGSSFLTLYSSTPPFCLTGQTMCEFIQCVNSCYFSTTLFTILLLWRVLCFCAFHFCAIALPFWYSLSTRKHTKVVNISH